MYYFFSFIIYSFLGYLCEVIYVSVSKRALSDRGFLYGPVCPIYGYGAIIILISLRYFYENNMWYLVFILGVIITSIVEYFTSYLLEKLFNIRLWDYSTYKYNINGRVCLKNSFLFGVMALIVFYVTQPIIDNILLNIQYGYLEKTLFWCLLVVYIIDTIVSIVNHINLSKIIYSIDSFINNINDKIEEGKDSLLEYFSNKRLIKRLSKMDKKYPNMKLIKNKKRYSIRELLNRLVGKE